jgi:hypothetical protein
MWHVDGTSYVELDPRGNVSGNPLHSTRKIFDHPDAYEFATPIIATYAPWFDPAYWYQGLSPKFDLRGQLHALKVTAKYYGTVLFLHKGPLMLLMALLLVLQYRHKVRFRYRWLLWMLPSLVPIAALTLLFVEDRYIGGFVLSVCTLVLGCIQLRDQEFAKRVFSVTTLVMVVGTFAFLTLQSVRALRDPPHNSEFEVADSLIRDFHLVSGDGVACIGYCFDMYWARLAHVRLIAEVPAQITADNAARGPVRSSVTTPAEQFWVADRATQNRVLSTLARTGARVVVAVRPPAGADLRDWSSLGSSNYYARAFLP